MTTTYAMDGRTALVTGAGKRLGAVIARRLHEAGARVVLHARNSIDEARAICDELNRVRADSAIVASADVSDDAQLPGLIAKAIDAFSRLDLLVNNASTFYATPFGSISRRDWDDLVGTNLRAPLFLSQAAAPHLRAARGLIINMVDIHAQRPLPDYVVYCIAKAGLAMLTRSLARELGPQVRVNGIAPGPVLWPEGGIDPAIKQEIIDKTALKRVGSPEDIARTVLFLACDAPFVTGQIIAVDGGRSIGW